MCNTFVKNYCSFHTPAYNVRCAPYFFPLCEQCVYGSERTKKKLSDESTANERKMSTKSKKKRMK